MDNKQCCYSNPRSYGTEYNAINPPPPECFKLPSKTNSCHTGECHSRPNVYGQMFRNEHDYYWGCKQGTCGCSHAKKMSAFQGIA